jgi:hypothetical protein
VSRPLAFISHSSEDLAAARIIADILRQRGIEPWLDHERIRPGDSVPGRIEEGISGCDVILLLISKSFIRSRWCRAEYESLMSKEIKSGRTLVIPVRLDDAKMPALLSAKKYTDVRDSIGGTAMEELAETILDRHSTAVIRRLLPSGGDAKRATYGYSLLSMIISKVIDDYPTVAVSREKILKGRSILDLYRTVETLIMHYEDLCDEILDLVGDAEDGAAYHVSPWRIQRANRRLLGIANDMRDIARSLDGIVDGNSPLHRRLAEVLELCTQISVSEDMLLIRLGAPPVLPDRPLRYDSLMRGRSPDRLRREMATFPFEDGQNLDSFMVVEIEKLLSELNTYKVQLRSAVAAARAES